MNFDQARYNMVEQQIRPWEVLDQDVLDLLYVVPREAFVPSASRQIAFADVEIPLEEDSASGERMWAPKMEARVMQALGVSRTDRVLEVGTGSGYLTALLAQRGAHVYSIEIKPKLAEFGRANLARQGVENVTLETGDGARGQARWAPYDVIVLTGSTPVLPATLLDQLAPNGRLFAVVGEAPAMAARLIVNSSLGARSSVQSALAHTDLFETVIAPLANAEQPPRFRF